MRNINRISVFTQELNRIWATYFSDWRFGQFMMNFLGWGSNEKIDPFFSEEEEMLNYLYQFCGEKK